MGLIAVAFYALSAVAVGAALAVISARNPVHSVLFLILTFFSAAGLFVLLGAEFLAMLLVVVYVGAVAVLFLFVVMMLDVNFAELKEGFLSYMPLGALVGLALLAELILVTSAKNASAHATLAPPTTGTNALEIGRVLYTDYVYFFQAAGIVLLIAMIGAITLTLRHKPHIKRQNPGDQVNRDRLKSVEIKPAATGEGVSAEELV